MPPLQEGQLARVLEAHNVNETNPATIVASVASRQGTIALRQTQYGLLDVG